MMTEEAKVLAGIYEASSDQGKDLISRALWVYLHGTEEAKTLLDQVSKGGLTIPQIVALVATAEKMSGKA